MVDVFINDRAGFETWADQHQAGYILNLRGGTRPAMLHRTACGHIYPPKAEYGNFTTKGKVCADRREAVEAWAREAGQDIVLCSDCDV